VLSLTMFFGCGEHEAVKEMNDFADKVCKCEDMKCVQDAHKELGELTKKYAEAKVTQGDADKITEATKRATTCISELPSKVAKKKKELALFFRCFHAPSHLAGRGRPQPVARVL